MNTQQGVIAPAQFNFNSNAIRVIADENGELWFIANDVCDILGYTNPSKTIKDHCRTPGVTKRYIGVVTGTTKSGDDAIQQVETIFINEGNLYRLIIKSRKPEAEPFESWVCDEVLPTIRKTGKYEQSPEPKTKKALPNGLSLEQQDTIKALVNARAEGLLSELRHCLAPVVVVDLPAQHITYERGKV